MKNRNSPKLHHKICTCFFIYSKIIINRTTKPRVGSADRPKLFVHDKKASDFLKMKKKKFFFKNFQEIPSQGTAPVSKKKFFFFHF
jgi:hypothetical protein